jgi:hypothetical protein
MSGRSRCRGLTVVALLTSVIACQGSKPPSAPTPPAVTTRSVQVGTAGNASTTLSPGESRQLVATATQSDGSTVDITNLAIGQSGLNPNGRHHVVILKR